MFFLSNYKSTIFIPQTFNSRSLCVKKAISDSGTMLKNPFFMNSICLADSWYQTYKNLLKYSPHSSYLIWTVYPFYIKSIFYPFESMAWWSSKKQSSNSCFEQLSRKEPSVLSPKSISYKSSGVASSSVKDFQKIVGKWRIKYVFVQKAQPIKNPKKTNWLNS